MQTYHEILALFVFISTTALRLQRELTGIESNWKDSQCSHAISYLEGSIVLFSDGPFVNLKHNPKTGGSFTKHVLDFLLGSNLSVNEEFTPSPGIGPMPSTSAFKIGMIREPCSQYLSLWSFCVIGQRREDPIGDPVCLHPALSKTVSNATLNDTGLFRRFVKTFVSNDGKIGLATCRTHYNYVNRSEEDMQKEPALNNACSDFEQLQEVPSAAILRDFAQGNPMASSDCWLYTETLTKDLRKCLEMFEMRSGRSANLSMCDKAVCTPR